MTELVLMNPTFRIKESLLLMVKFVLYWYSELKQLPIVITDAYCFLSSLLDRFGFFQVSSMFTYQLASDPKSKRG